MFSRLLFVALSLMATTALAVDRRPYDEGPLTAEDFLHQPKTVPKGTVALTATELRFEYKYRYKSNARNTTATLSSLEITAYIRRDLSWNLSPESKRLLDHEQGHADIAQIQCLKARLAARKIIGLQATAGSIEEAQAALGREVSRHMQPFEDAMREADAEYDRETFHGLGGKQAEWRRVQVETLKKLGEE